MTKRHAKMIQQMRDNAEEQPPQEDEDEDIGSDLVSMEFLVVDISVQHRDITALEEGSTFLLFCFN